MRDSVRLSTLRPLLLLQLGPPSFPHPCSIYHHPFSPYLVPIFPMSPLFCSALPSSSFSHLPHINLIILPPISIHYFVPLPPPTYAPLPSPLTYLSTYLPLPLCPHSSFFLSYLTPS
ncbi:hypothetical protein BDQ17DRAFT_1382193 [Cyathus striatus]|nr:hypothetical protein BDQ17DRAFT_1382193 [Cyathus striatus]